jgi:hypothetical protein
VGAIMDNGLDLARNLYRYIKGDVLVCHRPEHQLPILRVTFKAKAEQAGLQRAAAARAAMAAQRQRESWQDFLANVSNAWQLHSKRNSRANVQCFKCAKMGHVVNECQEEVKGGIRWVLKPWREDPCWACGNLGHWSTNAACPAQR